MPRVHNKYHNTAPRGALNIMRPNREGNPFTIGTDGDRQEVLQLFWGYLWTALYNGLDLEYLRGKDLVCCCKPKACHGDILFGLANTDIDAGYND